MGYRCCEGIRIAPASVIQWNERDIYRKPTGATAVEILPVISAMLDLRSGARAIGLSSPGERTTWCAGPNDQLCGRIIDRTIELLRIESCMRAGGRNASRHSLQRQVNIYCRFVLGNVGEEGQAFEEERKVARLFTALR